jgi:hypothetical protein
MLRVVALILGCLFFPGCVLLPEIAHQPTLHNPFPQLTRVAVAPFFNHSHEPTLNVRKVAGAYGNELQLVPGFEVIPVVSVERTMQDNQIELRSPADARRLAQILGADALVIGAVMDYSPYYPPRMTLQVQWYAANPGFHSIPPGYGLPWGTPGEQDIPAPLIFEAEMALAKAQLKTQSPPYEKLPLDAPVAQRLKPDNGGRAQDSNVPPGGDRSQTAGSAQATPANGVPLSYQAEMSASANQPRQLAAAGGMPPDWPDPRGFVPPPPSCDRPKCIPTEAPVLMHTRAYDGHDADFTQALVSYHKFRDDARLGGWQGYLQRSDDFTRFCCHMHIWEMLSARGGAGETRVVWRWPSIR